MNIAIIGAGNIGGTLGGKWAAAGNQVRYGVRNPADSKYDDLRHSGSVTTIEEALDDAEVVLFSMPGGAVTEFVGSYGARLAGKTLIDATNVVGGAEMNNLAVLKENVTGARLSRAFSTLGWENFADPVIGGVSADLFFCADAGARPQVESLIRDIGLRPVFVGDLDTAPIIDGLTRLWFSLAFAQGRGRRIALKLLEDGTAQ